MLLEKIRWAMATGDESELRKDPEGREFLLSVALDERRVPLHVRRMGRLMAESLATTVDSIRISVLMS